MKANQKNEAHFLNMIRTGQLLIREDGTIMNAVTLKVYDYTSKSGHVHVAAKVNGRVLHILAHRLIHLAKIGPLEPDDHVIHLDGNKKNNRPSNLQKMDDSDAALHAFATGANDKAVLSRKAFEYYEFNLAPNAKLSHPQIIEIRNRYEAGETRYKLAKEFNMVWKDIAKIVAGTSYRAVKPAKLNRV